MAVVGTKRDAERALAEAIHLRDTGIDIQPERLDVAAYLRRWLRDYAVHNVAAATLVRYTAIVERHLVPAIGSVKLIALRPAHIQAAYSGALSEGGRVDGRSGGLSPRTVLQHHRVLREALKHAELWQLIPRNPADAVTPPRFPKKEIAALSVEETRRLLEQAEGTAWYAIIYLAVASGARLGELLALRWSDVDLDRGAMKIARSVQRISGKGFIYSRPKTSGSSRAVALSPETVRVLREHRREQVELRLALGPDYEDGDLIFPWGNGRPLERGAVRTALQKIARNAGLAPPRFHDLRHTAATLMLASGVHPKIVAERLGHATIAVTLDTYSHVLPDMQRDAAKLLDAILRADGK